MGRRRKGRDISGWVIVDKPAGITSTSVVNKVRWALDAKKAGHAGTLDPEATGVLAIALGEATESGEHAASLECIPDTVSYGFGGGIYDIKVAAGLTWDSYSFTWVSDVIQPTATSTLMENHQYDVVEDCLPASEFNLGGVSMGDALDTLGKLGSPERIDDPSGVGEEIDRMMLVDTHIDIFQDVVFGMSTTSPDWQMPSGLRVGLTRGEVIRILGRVPNGYTATSQIFHTRVCSEERDAEDEWSILIEFGQDKRVQSINFISPSY